MAETRSNGKRKRVALVIGNAAYANAPSLNNARTDAHAVAAQLQAVGFAEVTVLDDLGYEPMRRALQQFGRAAGEAEIAIIYYAGHAIEVDGENYLIPTDAKLDQDRDVMFETVSLAQVLRSIEGPGLLRLAILDACRDSPFRSRMEGPSRTRSIGRGLADVEPGGNTLVAFSAKGGTVALDGEGPHSPFAQALIELLPTPGLELGFLFRQVRDAVLRATARKQEPYLCGSLGADHIFLVPEDTVPVETPDSAAVDVFISYASADRDQAEALARELEADGYQVWWDTKLLGGQQYRKAIVSRLDVARAAVVIWSDISVESDWVYDEANRARAAGKLIPVRLAGLDPKAIQPPFGALHTIAVDDRAGLRAALAGRGVLPRGGAAQAAPVTRGPVDERTLEHDYWIAIQASSDPCDFEALLEKFPHGVYAQVARKRVESLLAAATAAPQVDRFLHEYPQSERAAFARKRKTALEWSEIEKLGDERRMRDFIARDGEGADVEQAKAALAKIEWSRVAMSDKPEDIEKVLSDLRGFPEAALASARLDALRVEAAAWAAAAAANDVPSFEKYLKAYPHGAHVSEAKERLNVLDPSPPIFNRATVNVPHINIPQIRVSAASVRSPYLAVILGGAVFATINEFVAMANLYGAPFAGLVYLFNGPALVYDGAIALLVWRLSGTANLVKVLGLFVTLYVADLAAVVVLADQGVPVRAVIGGVSLMVDWAVIAVIFLTLGDPLIFILAAAIGAAAPIYFTAFGSILPGELATYVTRLIDYPSTGLLFAYGFLRRHPEWKGTNWMFRQSAPTLPPSG